MGALVQSSLSALKSESAEICPVDLELDQFNRTYSGGFNFNCSFFNVSASKLPK